MAEISRSLPPGQTSHLTVLAINSRSASQLFSGPLVGYQTAGLPDSVSGDQLFIDLPSFKVEDLSAAEVL
jgi:hypothetical protein